MTRSRPLEIEFTAHDDPALLAQMAEVVARGTGWINLRPVIEEEDEPPPPGPFAFLGDLRLRRSLHSPTLAVFLFASTIGRKTCKSLAVRPGGQLPRWAR